MLRTVYWYIMSWLYLLITLPALIRVKYLEKRGRSKERDKFANNFSMMLARGLFYLTGSSVEIKGMDNIPSGQTVLFVSNHQSHMDSAIIHGFIHLQKGFIADKEVQSIPILSTWLKYMKCIFIDRGDIRHNVRSMEAGVRILKEGHSMVIYPEGRLDEGKQLGSFKKGCVKLAIKAGVPIIPITIRNSFYVMNSNGSRIKSAAVQCTISKPIFVSAIGNEDESILISKIRDSIADNLV